MNSLVKLITAWNEYSDNIMGSLIALSIAWNEFSDNVKYCLESILW